MRPAGLLATLVAVVLLTTQLAVGPGPAPWEERVDPPQGEGQGPGERAPAAPREPPPRLLVILTDDQRWDSLPYLPLTSLLVFDAGATFENAFVSTPVCCPSRANLLTGQYSHNNGVHGNDDALEGRTVVHDLRDAGYFTGLVGKYLNSWNGTNRSEFDRWVSFPGGHSTYVNPTLFIGDEKVRTDGYITNLFADHAEDFILEAAGREQPFLLLFWPNAPHRPATPAEGHERLYEGVPPHRPPSYNEANVSDKPQWLQDETLTSDEQEDLDRWRMNMLRSLASLDEAVAELVATLHRTGQLEDTAIFFLSDNGFFWGEHRLRGKGQAYEEAVRVPFAVRYPPLFVPGATPSQVVANIDVAPTLYELAGLPLPHDIDGRSLLDLGRGDVPWREGVILEAHRHDHPWVAVHTGSQIYIRTGGDADEYYDLTADPFQLNNAIDVPEANEEVRRLRGLLERLLEESGAPGDLWSQPAERRPH